MTVLLIIQDYDSDSDKSMRVFEYIKHKLVICDYVVK